MDIIGELKRVENEYVAERKQALLSLDPSHPDSITIMDSMAYEECELKLAQQHLSRFSELRRKRAHGTESDCKKMRMKPNIRLEPKIEKTELTIDLTIDLQEDSESVEQKNKTSARCLAKRARRAVEIMERKRMAAVAVEPFKDKLMHLLKVLCSFCSLLFALCSLLFLLFFTLIILYSSWGFPRPVTRYHIMTCRGI